MLPELAWRNLWRQPRRTFLNLLTISFAAAAAVFVSSLQRGGYAEVEQNALHLIDGYAQIQPRGYSNDPDLRRTITDPQELVARLNKLPGITAVAPRASSYAIVSLNQRSYGSAVFGVDPRKETNLSALSGAIVRGRYLRPGDTDSVVLGEGLARNLNLSPGKKIMLLGAARDGSVAADFLTVTGIFSTGVSQLDHQVIEMPLSRFQTDFALGHRINVIAITGSSLPAVEADLPALEMIAGQSGLVVRNWTNLEPALHDAILIDSAVSHMCYVSLLVIIVFIILNTLLMTVLERTKEFGMLLAIGMRPSEIGRVLWFELLFLALIGICFGILIGVGVTLWDSKYGIPIAGAQALFAQWHMSAVAYPKLTLHSTIVGPLEIATGIILAGIVPYLRINRLQPVAAMRSS
ncbi:MAG: ABC transporter permease [Alphaproteobacteria bacterium]|nr:ABC transporter permease [Alphaproteobacteria bacterium]